MCFFLCLRYIIGPEKNTNLILQSSTFQENLLIHCKRVQQKRRKIANFSHTDFFCFFFSVIKMEKIRKFSAVEKEKRGSHQLFESLGVNYRTGAVLTQS